MAAGVSAKLATAKVRIDDAGEVSVDIGRSLDQAAGALQAAAAALITPEAVASAEADLAKTQAENTRLKAENAALKRAAAAAADSASTSDDAPYPVTDDDPLDLLARAGWPTTDDEIAAPPLTRGSRSCTARISNQSKVQFTRNQRGELVNQHHPPPQHHELGAIMCVAARTGCASRCSSSSTAARPSTRRARAGSRRSASRRGAASSRACRRCSRSEPTSTRWTRAGETRRAQFGAILRAILPRNSDASPPPLQVHAAPPDVRPRLLRRLPRAPRVEGEVDAALPDGSTALYLAAQNERADCAHLLLQHNATVDCLNSQRATPLYVAALRGDELTVDLLVAAKASVDRPIPLDASTPLVAAARAATPTAWRSCSTRAPPSTTAAPRAPPRSSSPRRAATTT